VALVSASDVQARLSAQAYARLFAKNGGATVDSTYLSLCVSEAESQIRVWTGAAFPTGFDVAGGTVDVAIVGAAVDVVCYLAAKRHPSAGEAEAYRLGFLDAREFFKALNRDADARVATSGAGRPKPRANLNNSTDSAGLANAIFVDVADRKTNGGF